MTDTHTPIPEPTQLDDDVVAIWAWFPGDLLCEDPDMSAWDLYLPWQWRAGIPHEGGAWSASPRADPSALARRAAELLDRPVVLTEGSWVLRTGELVTTLPLFLCSTLSS